jgi:ATP phosphoribosyltransferase regulatory subunit
MNNERWLLPEGIEELLPPQAARLESLRRELLDLFTCWGYELVIPSLVEYLDSLLTGTGNDLELQTFKLTDQMNGRLMGVRADITPQVARIDAHRLLDREGPVRLCYQGTVLHTRGDGLGGARSFTQIGAELYGHSGVESDAEMVCMMLKTLALAKLGSVYVDLGHVGIFRALTQAAELNPEQEMQLFDALQRKAVPEIQTLLADMSVDAATRQGLEDLVWLNGDSSVLVKARQSLADNDAALQAVDEVERVAARVSRQQPDVQLHFDLAELRGFHYHTGVVFAAYQPGQGQSIAQGGRYDDIGKVFGRARAATGFSTDLRSLIALGDAQATVTHSVFAPAGDDAALQTKIAELRAAGTRVVCELPGQNGGATAAGCSQILLVQDGQWIVADASK